MNFTYKIKSSRNGNSTHSRLPKGTRPDNMRVHVDFKHYFDQSSAQPPKCVADNIELKWETSNRVGRL